jgi:hypothetical protein
MRYILQNISELPKVKKNRSERMLMHAGQNSSIGKTARKLLKQLIVASVRSATPLKRGVNESVATAQKDFVSRPMRTRSIIALVVGFASVVYGTTVSIKSDADSFVRTQAPANNYGGGGALSVSGGSAMNGSGQQNGAFDTLMKFPMSDAVGMLNADLGQDWIVTGARLVVTEMAIPDNAIFNRGVGQFEIRWIASDNWIEGTGRPNAPTSDGVTWQELAGILNSNLDKSLGVFTNTGTDVQISFSLNLADGFIATVRTGGELSLYLTAVSPDIGFTFNSRNFGNTNAQPFLELKALANPKRGIDTIVLSNTNAIVTFDTVSNWNYRVLGADNLSGPWTCLVTVPAQPTNGHISFVKGVARGERFCRLKLSADSGSTEF